MDHSGGFYDAGVKVVTAHVYKIGLYLLYLCTSIKSTVQRYQVEWPGSFNDSCPSLILLISVHQPLTLTPVHSILTGTQKGNTSSWIHTFCSNINRWLSGFSITFSLGFS